MTSIRLKYTAGGVLFGALFPVAGLGVEYFVLGHPLVSPVAVARENPIHAIVAMAPLVLGMTFFFIGRSQDDLWRIATRDTLTGHANRHQMERDLARLLNECPRRPFHAALVDLDGFKFVNDTFGHNAGDTLLRKFSDRLSALLDSDQTLYRLGGDEFLIILLDCEADEAERLGRAIITALEIPFDVAGRNMTVAGSIGISTVRDADKTPSDLLGRADLALYRVKAEMGGGVRFYDEAAGDDARHRFDLEQDLRRGLDQGEFFLEYQPITTRTSEISGFEALVRWKHPERGTVSPATFIEVAEFSGLIIPLGEAVLDMACAEALTWPDHLSVSVNVSPDQFKQRNFVDRVVQILERRGFKPERLILEITESLFTSNMDKVRETLRELRRRGVRFALDDFGTGFSSINHLRNLDVDYLKIDRSFAQSATDPRDVRLIKVIADLGHSFGLSVTAEGIETIEQMEIMRAHGADHFQGFYFSRPMQAQDIRVFLELRTEPETLVSNDTGN